MSLFDLTGRHAVVIAATSTLGDAMSVGLVQHGARLSCVSRNQDKAASLASRLVAMGGEAAPFCADVTRADDLRRLLAETTSWGGPMHVLLNCAGINSATPFFEVKQDEWDRIMDVNVGSVVRTCQIFGAHMKEHGEGASVINVSSASAGPPLSRVLAYSASKAALDNATQFMAREFAPHGVRVNAIVPGFFPAAQNRRILSEERRAAIMSHTPMGRFGNPEELVGAVVWLASTAASGFVTGALIRVDGGFGAMTI